MPSTTNFCFAFWIEVLLHHSLATPFNNHTSETATTIKNAANIAAATNLLKGAQANLAFLNTTMGLKYRCLIYRHLEEFGSLILNQQARHYALLGFGNSTQPVTIDTTILFDAEDKNIPRLDYIKDLDTPTKLNVKPSTNGTHEVQRTKVALHSTILLPCWIPKELEETKVSTFFEIFLLIQEKAHSQDTLVETKQDNNTATPRTTYREDFLHILQSP
eukprot:15356886-Ditylum_brightwellii.AAC.1